MKIISGTALLLVMLATATARAQINFSNFHTPAQVDFEINNLVAAHPSIAKSFTFGTSVEGRPLRGIKISDNVNTDETDEGDVVFVGLHHAREWITVEMSLYLAEYLLNHYATDAQLRTCMNNLEIWIIPVLNPDGYFYSAASPANRCWRKNRRNNKDGTFGVDLNRNYSYQWGLGAGGSEGSPNSWEDTYRGPAPFSEPETRAFRDFVLGLHNSRALLSYHSYGELFLRPWGYTTADPPGEPTLAFLAQNSIARISAVHGHTYAENISYNAFGEMTDFFWSRSRLAGLTPELRPNNATGSTCPGFNPPPATIIPNNEENLPAAPALIKDAGCRKLWIKDHAADIGAEPSAVWTGTNWSNAFWESPDIWTVPATLVGGATVTLNVRVHNDSGATMNGSIVRTYYTDPRVSLEFPNPGAVLIGQKTVNLPAGDSTIPFTWTIPTGPNSWGEFHWCVGAIVSHPEDRPLTTEIQRSSNIGGRNFQTTVITNSQTLAVAVTNYLDVAAEYAVTLDSRSLPRGWEVILPPPPRESKPNRKALLLGVKGPLLEPGQTALQPVRVLLPADAKAGEEVELRLNGMLKPLVAGKRIPVGNGYTFHFLVSVTTR